MNHFGFRPGSHVWVDTKNYYSGHATVLEVQKKHYLVWMTAQARQQKVPKRLCAMSTFVGWIYFTRDGDLRVTQTWQVNPPLPPPAGLSRRRR